MTRGALGTYRRKRHFAKTSEPRGRVARGRRPRGLAYVIQKHDATRLHYDLRLELDGVMKSWAVPRGPSLDPKVKRMAVHVEDHPIEYNRFEGVIPKGEYGGGPVLIWDRGVWIPEGDAREAYRKGALKFRLEGEKLHGSWVLVRTRQTQRRKEPWLLIKHQDDAARPEAKTDIVVKKPRSVVSGRTIEEIERSFHRRSSRPAGRPLRAGRPASSRPRSAASPVKPADLPGARRATLPAKLAPVLATLVDEAPPGQEWLHEIKYDGYRALCRVSHGKVRIFTRRGNDWTDKFAAIARALTALPVREAWLDGEIVVLTRNGTSSFPALVDALGDDTAQERLIATLFDLPYLDGFDLRRVPLEARKQTLERIVRAGTSGQSGPIRYSDHVAGRGESFFQEACRAGLEGIIAKRAGSLYREGRGRDWLKVKCLQTRELAIVGYTDPGGSRKGFGALVLGEANDGRMVHVGRVGTGFTDRMLQDLRPRLEALEVGKPTVDPAPRGAAARGVHWVDPQLVADVAFMERTRDGILRHPTFRGLREDKSPRETRGEAAGTELDARVSPRRGGARSRMARRWRARAPGAGPRLTNKVLYPEDGVTKRRLVDYYVEVQDRLMPYIKDRPLTVYRCPEGIGKFCFWEKHRAEALPRGLRSISLDDRKTEKERGRYFYAASMEGVLALVQLGTLEFHVWGSRASQVERPDLMIFDIDPDVGLAWSRVVEACLAVRRRLKELGLRSWLKTTGGKGLHVCVPLAKRQDWDEVKSFARALSEDLVRREPLRYTANLPKVKRKGRIFIDYLRNGRGATAVAAYSTRARAGAPVSMPLSWDELKDPRLRPDRFTVANARDRLRRRDPWTGFDLCRQTITAAMRRELQDEGNVAGMTRKR